ncbi:MAG: 4Fe-4S ferredoxin [Methanomicrobiales archaeon]
MHPRLPEGALQLIDGKARLVSDLFCDGLGTCIGTCPEGAISIVEREAVAYDERAVVATIVSLGAPVIRAHLEHLLGHGQRNLYNEAIDYLIEHTIPIPAHNNTTELSKKASTLTPGPGKPAGTSLPEPAVHLPFAACPGSAARSIPRNPHVGARMPDVRTSSELRQWPVQLALLNADAQYFEDADLLVSADCVPFAYAGFHSKLLRDKILVIFCPKLDADIDAYIEKLAAIFSSHTIKSITVVNMEVPCCGGVRYVVDRALERSGKKIPVTEKMITIQGEIQ